MRLEDLLYYQYKSTNLETSEGVIYMRITKNPHFYKHCYYQNSSMKVFVLIVLGFRKLGLSSEMENDALMHREGLK